MKQTALLLLALVGMLGCTPKEEVADLSAKRKAWITSLGYTEEATLDYVTTKANAESAFGVFRRDNSIIVVRRTHYDVRGYSSVMTPSPWRVELSTTADFANDITPQCGATQLSNERCDRGQHDGCMEEAWSYTIPNDKAGRIWYRIRNGWVIENISSDKDVQDIVQKVKQLERSSTLPIVMQGSIQWP